MEVGISTGEFDVISHGTVIGFPGEPIVFSLKDIIISIVFVSDELVEGKPIRALPSNNPKLLNLEFINHDSDFGTGNIEPLSIGTIEFKELLLNYRASSLNKSKMVMLNYTWLLGKEKAVHNG
jgi:hypothetical protein